MALRTPSLQNDNVVAIDREIGSQYDNVRVVAENIESVVTVADHIENVDTVATNIVDVHAVGGSIVDVRTVATNMNSVIAVEQDIVNIDIVAAHVDSIDAIVTDVIPNMTEVVNASANAAIATTKAQEASVSAAAALVNEQNAKASELAAGVSENNAATSEAVAIAKASDASASADAAHVSELAAAAILDMFDDRYLGAFASNPIVDNDGNALLNGAIYFNTATHNLRVYDAGLVDWIALSSVTFAGLQDVSLTSVATGDVLKWNGTDWVNTKTVGLNSLQLLGGTGTQGTVTWNTDEETLDVIQNGATLQLGQETQIHVRNNSGSSIADGKVVMATGALGASGRITAGLYDGTADVKYVLGVSTETIANGDDGKVTNFGKIRGINTSAWNEGDVLYAATAGGLTNAAPVTGVKLAVAFVITKHAVNGTIMVRVNGVDELRYEPKNTNIQTHIASTSNPHSVTKTQVGLSNVDNTSDANKPISSATQTALNLKANLASPTFTGTVSGITKTMVGLSNVDNTSDVTKNVLSATKLTTARAISLTGDVTGTVNFDGSSNVSVATTIAANSVALGTDTTGNYVADVTAGGGIVVTGTAGEGWSPTVAHADTSSQASVDNSAGNVIQDVTVDTYGHVTAIGSTNLDNRYLSALGGVMDLGLITEAIG